MAKMNFRKAKRQAVNLRILLVALSGQGKTYTGLALSMHLADLMGLPPESVGVIDSEVTSANEGDQGSAEKYEGEACQCDECRGGGITLHGFQTLLLAPEERTPDDYTDAIKAAEGAGIKVLLIDSITHEWEGCLAMVDRLQRGPKRNSYTAWGDVTPKHDRFIQAIQNYPGHVVCTVRGKEKHEQTPDKKIRSLGIQPVQRNGIEYEFDLGAFLNGGTAQMIKSRASALDGKFYARAGLRLANDALGWAQGGNAEKDRAEAEARKAAAKTAVSKPAPDPMIEGEELAAALSELTEVGADLEGDAAAGLAGWIYEQDKAGKVSKRALEAVRARTLEVAKEAADRKAAESFQAEPQGAFPFPGSETV